jgi:hypothetical protein
LRGLEATFTEHEHYGGITSIHEALACLVDPFEDAAKMMRGWLLHSRAYAPSAGLHIKAVGVVTNATFRRVTESLGYGVDVRWVPMPDGRIALGPVEDHSDYMRRGSLYEEFNPDVIRRVLDVLVTPRLQ